MPTRILTTPQHPCEKRRRQQRKKPSQTKENLLSKWNKQKIPLCLNVLPDWFDDYIDFRMSTPMLKFNPKLYRTPRRTCISFPTAQATVPRASHTHTTATTPLDQIPRLTGSSGGGEWWRHAFIKRKNTAPPIMSSFPTCTFFKLRGDRQRKIHDKRTIQEKTRYSKNTSPWHIDIAKLLLMIVFPTNWKIVRNIFLVSAYFFT